jgi:hypothetical protein
MNSSHVATFLSSICTSLRPLDSKALDAQSNSLGCTNILLHSGSLRCHCVHLPLPLHAMY